MLSRNRHIDIARGIGILLVVFGHNHYVLSQQRELFNIVFSFHMPLFFFLSGIFFNTSRSFTRTLADKSDTLLKPYLVSLAIVAPLFGAMEDANPWLYLTGVLYGNGNTLPFHWIPLWFLPNLIAVMLFAWLLVRMTGNFAKTIWSQLLIVAMLHALGVVFIEAFWPFDFAVGKNVYQFPGLPFSIDIVPLTASFFLLGLFLRERLLAFRPSHTVFAGVVIIFVAAHFYFDKTIDLNLRRYDGFILPAIEALCGIYMVLYLSAVADGIRGLGRLLAVVGSASLVILVFHFWFQVESRRFAVEVLGVNDTLANVFSFLFATTAPLLLWALFRKSSVLALFYLPLKSNRIFQRAN